MGFFSSNKDMGIDLGTANTLVFVKGKGIVLSEPSVVAINSNTRKPLAVGQEAKLMIGRTPGNIVAIRPLKDGVIADFEVAQTMLKKLIEKVTSKSAFTSPRIIVCYPSGVTEVERRAIEEAAKFAGARDVVLMEELDQAIIAYVKKEFSLMIGERTAEQIKMELGSAYKIDEENASMDIKGRDMITGLPKIVTITESQIREALKEPVYAIIESIKTTLEKTPPELSADIMEKGIMLAGGGALLKGLDKLINHETNMPVHIAETPLDCVVLGAGKALDNFDELSKTQRGQ